MGLSNQAADVLKMNGITFDRIGRHHRKMYSLEIRRWIYCGWYWEQVVDGRMVMREGPFPTKSAAGVDALRRLDLLRIVDPSLHYQAPVSQPRAKRYGGTKIETYRPSSRYKF